MKSDSGETKSVWMSAPGVRSEGALKENTKTDVCVVGAGISGLTTAYLLALEGKDVVVLDDGPIAGGETCRTTAHVTHALDDRYFNLERLHGSKGARLAAESHTCAINQIEQIVKRENIDCDFHRVDGYLFLDPEHTEDLLDRELEAAHRIGLQTLRKENRAPLPFDTGPCLHFPNQAQFHPLKYLNGVAHAFMKRGGRIHPNTAAMGFEGGPPAKVETKDKLTITCGSIVVATNTPVNDRVVIHTKQAPYRTYVIGARVPKGSIQRGLYWDTAEPYHYVRLQDAEKKSDDYEILIVGGEDHKTAQATETDVPFGKLEAWAKKHFPMIESIEFRWSGQVMEPVDGLGFIGRNPADKENVFIITGDSGNGMTHGTIGGMLVRDLILGRKNEWADLYEPGRITLRASGTFARENLNVAKKYGELATPGEVKDVAEIKPGTGAVIRRGLKKIAVYRDDSGKTKEFSAICPHLGCVLGWNSVEKSWDCPCHGSRFNCTGKVMNGPSLGDMNTAEETK